MADIKTRDVIKGSIKTIDKAAVASSKMKRAYISTKDKAENSTQAKESSAEEYASDRYEGAVNVAIHKGVHQFEKAGRSSVHKTKDNFYKAKDGVQKFKESRASKQLERQATNRHGRKNIKGVEQAKKTVKESVTSAGKKTIKTTKQTAKVTAKTVKTAEKTAKTTIKTSEHAVKTMKKTAEATAKAAQKAAIVARETARAAITATKVAIKATIAAVKAIITAAKALVTAIIAGGWVAVVIIIVICLVALIMSSVFGIFFSGEDSGTGITMQSVVCEINSEYDTRLAEERASTTYDVLEMTGSRAVWKEVLAVYSVKVNTDTENPQEVATIDENKKEILKEIFWEMNSISSRTESRTDTVITETDDGRGNIVQTETTITQTYLIITVSHKSVEEMASEYGFNDTQLDYLSELLSEENESLWASVLYGITTSDDQIVTVALSQVGNVGGEPYWSWYGFGARVEWCACFVSWCANESGYIETGIIPKFALCTNGEDWFKARNQWADASHEPTAGTLIFFDWNLDGSTDHVGIVQKCENGTIYTVEGNSNDICRTHTYAVGADSIYGYGIPAY